MILIKTYLIPQTPDATGRQVSWVVKKSFRLTKLKIEDEIDNMQTQN